ncbi:hypothetical protein GCM10010275_39690 [Streptomyces litmocidini]|nr:hypothetical protein GCM10010275_39690 [Streptomyces litmocidini]
MAAHPPPRDRRAADCVPREAAGAARSVEGTPTPPRPSPVRPAAARRDGGLVLAASVRGAHPAGSNADGPVRADSGKAGPAAPPRGRAHRTRVAGQPVLLKSRREAACSRRTHDERSEAEE